MKEFFEYLNAKKKTVAASLLFAAVFFAVFALYRVPPALLLYPTLLCFLAGLLFLFLDFLRCRKLRRQLEAVSRMSAGMMDAIPEAGNFTDPDYVQIIGQLRSQILELASRDFAKYSEMVDYYTVWVHQIKTPIAVMKLMLAEEDSPLSRRLSSELLRIEQYVEVVLAFLRLDSESAVYVFRKKNLDEIIRPAIKKFAPEFILRKLRVEYEPIEKTIVTDEKWLSFVLEQLLSNALKYTREGCIRIYMRSADLLCVEDTGMGIAPEDLPRIFVRGYTGYNGRSDKNASGIGLYLCKRVCDKLGIAIAAESEVGRGTAILLDLSQYQKRAE